MTRVLVCGGRHFGIVPRDTPLRFRVSEQARADRQRASLFIAMDKLHFERRLALIIHGGAPGADSLAGEWADERGVRVRAFPITSAEWADVNAPGARIKRRRDGSLYNANAGPARNQRMLVDGRPDLVVAFTGGTGTADMVRRAVDAGVEIIEVHA